MFQLEKIVRKNIWSLKPYSSARDEYTGDNAILLDANENPFASAYNRYPDPQQRALKHKIADLKNVVYNQVFLGNGSDEPIDLVYRIFCEPGRDNVIIPNPTYGMYQVCADINNIKVKSIPLKDNYQLDTVAMLEAVDENTRLIFICSPNNPTANSMDESDIEKILETFKSGIVVLDEAYLDFSGKKGMLSKLSSHPNLVILQTFSKAWGLAGIRLGMAFASKEIVGLMTRVKYPYNINSISQQIAMQCLEDISNKNYQVQQIVLQRGRLVETLTKLEIVKNVLPSETNFIMVKFENAGDVYEFLVERKIIVRDRSNIHLCLGCLRVTVGTKEENQRLVNALEHYSDTLKL